MLGLSKQVRQPRARRMRRLAAISSAVPSAQCCSRAPAPSPATPDIQVREATTIRSIYPSEFGEARPAALTYSPEEEALFLADAKVDGTLDLVGVTTIEDPAGEVTATIPETTTTADTLAFDPVAERVHRPVRQRPRGDHADRRGRTPRTCPTSASRRRWAPRSTSAGRWYILDEATKTIFQLSSASDPAATVVTDPDPGPRRGLRFRARRSTRPTARSTRWTARPRSSTGSTRRASFDGPGTSTSASAIRARWCSRRAPTTPTIRPRRSLFLADSGSGAVLGQVLEVSLAAAIAAPVNENATLVRTSNLANLNPPVPDSAGIAYIPSQNNLMVVDSEVEEMSIYQGRQHVEDDPHGGPRSDRDHRRILQRADRRRVPNGEQSVLHLRRRCQPGLPRPARARRPLGKRATTSPAMSTRGTSDRRTPRARRSTTTTTTTTSSTASGTEVYDIAPGPNGVPGNGVAPQGDDVATHFDVGQFGAMDPEGIAVDESNNHIFVLDHKSRDDLRDEPDGHAPARDQHLRGEPDQRGGARIRPLQRQRQHQELLHRRPRAGQRLEPERERRQDVRDVGRRGRTNTAPVVNAGAGPDDHAAELGDA